MTTPFCIRNVAAHEETLLDECVTDVLVPSPTRVTSVSRGRSDNLKTEVINIRARPSLDYKDATLVVRMSGLGSVATLEEAPCTDHVG